MPASMSPLRYPGGKIKLYNFVKHTMEINGLTNTTYCEPFSGGAGLAITLLLSNDVQTIILNDFDIAIYSVWYAIINDSERLISKIKSSPLTVDEWHIQKNIYKQALNNNLQEYNFDLAFSTFFLNRTNRAGIITGGPIGGYAQQSTYKLGCRFNKENIIRKIRKIAEQRGRIHLYNLDAVDLINNVLLNQEPTQLFIYFDPPYYKQGKRLYQNFFNDEKHLQLSGTIRQMDHFKWIATYDNESRIRDIYEDRTIYEYKLQYSANKPRKETELLFHSNDTIIESYDTVRF